MAFIKPEYDDDSNMEIKEEPFDSNVDEEKYEPNDQNLCEDNSTNGDYEDLPSTSRANDKRSTKRPAQEETPSSGKRRKTQVKQMDMIISFMETHPHLANNYLPNSLAKTESKILWKELAEKLNAYGPRQKIFHQWKTVWKDYKYNLKRKMRNNFLISTGTAVGSNKRVPYSKNEISVIKLLNLHEAHVLGKQSDGLNDSINEQLQESETNNLKYEEEYVILSDGTYDDAQPIDMDNDEASATQNSTMPCNSNLSKEKPVENRTSSLEMTVKMQEEELAELKEKLSSLENTQKSILKELQKTNRYHKRSDKWKKKMFQLKKDKLKEMKLNNVLKNKARLQLIEIKSKKLEIEQIKIGKIYAKQEVVESHNL